jgi:hypothetical protein
MPASFFVYEKKLPFQTTLRVGRAGFHPAAKHRGKATTKARRRLGVGIPSPNSLPLPLAHPTDPTDSPATTHSFKSLIYLQPTQSAIIPVFLRPYKSIEEIYHNNAKKTGIQMGTLQGA